MAKSTPIQDMRRLKGFEIACIDGSVHEFPPHEHDEFVLGANITGRECIKLDRKQFDASVNDVTLYNPGQMQAGGSIGGKWVFVSIYVSADLVQSVADLPPLYGFERPLLSSETFARRVRDFVALGLDRSFSETETTEHLVDLLSDLMDAAGSTPTRNATRARKEVSRVAECLRCEMASSSTLHDLARSEGLTPVQLVRAFKVEYGLPPFAWLATQRLKLARQRLSLGAKPAEVAADLGFADQAHLTRRFRAAFGTTPGAYARLK